MIIPAIWEYPDVSGEDKAGNDLPAEEKPFDFSMVRSEGAQTDDDEYVVMSEGNDDWVNMEDEDLIVIRR